jgi:hypothetical protein
MDHDEQLQWERQYAPYAAAAAVGSALLALAGFIYYANTVGSYQDSADLLVAVHKHSAAVIASSVLSALGVLLLAPVFAYLYTATKFRWPKLPRIALYLVLIVPVLAAVLSIVTEILQVHAASQLAHELPLSPKRAVDRADHFLKQGAAPVVGFAGFAASFGLAAGVALISLNARRAGLLSGFMGVLGVILGFLFAIPIIIGPAIIQFFWMLAVAVLFLDRWPGGRGPAWEAGEAIRWPSAAEQRAQAQGIEREPEPEPEPARTATATATHPRSKKRKRKRRS